LLVFSAKAYYDTNSIEIRHYRVRNSSLGEVLNGAKVAHLSDLHIKNIGVRENKILEILKEEKPDIILITGDIISHKGSYDPVLFFLHQIKAPYGIYAVLGNTEYSNENGSCILCHKEKSRSLKGKQYPLFLRNSIVSLRINARTLDIVGVDDPVEKKSDLRSTLRGRNPHAPSVLLAHSPEIFDEASNDGIDLLLCGHTHGGQIFIVRYLRKIFPLIDPSLEFLEGFFQKGKTLMYVSRGIGSTLLPFRLGVKPEITFLTFSNDTNNEKMRIARIGQVDRIAQMSQSNPMNTVSISNNPSKTIFAGLSFSSFVETFDMLSIFDFFYLGTAPQHQSSLTKTTNLTKLTNPINVKILFDFESDADLRRLSWECHKWFELSEQHVTSGKHSLKASLPPGQYAGISFREIPTDWSKREYLKMDVYNPSGEDIRFHIRIDDNKSGWEYADRFDIDVELRPNMNHLSIPTHSIKTNVEGRPLNLKSVERMMVFIPNNSKEREIYIDYIRLE
jgi:predicted MPP superfamily phosphohydrolase